MDDEGELRYLDADATSVRDAPNDLCDVVMKGGITSGVLYPSLLHAIGSRYGICGIGGASAGAIGAAVGAAAEFGRSTGGYERLVEIPGKLGDGRLAALFQPQRQTRQLLRLMLVATGNDRPGRRRSLWGRLAAIAGALVAAFPIAVLLGAAPGVVLVVAGALAGAWSGGLLVLCGVLLAVVGVVIALLVRLWHKLTVDVPANMFGICRGLGTADGQRGFTEWLCDEIDATAGLPARQHLTFGQLWKAPDEPGPKRPGSRYIDLRMITTCLSEGRPYEMPWEARDFFFDPGAWRTLFPESVVKALEEARSEPTEDASADSEHRRWVDDLAQRHNPPLLRLPEPAQLPVIVATRLSLSFPLLVSAVPLWTIDEGDEATRLAMKAVASSERAATDAPTSTVRFRCVWFTDGGFCSNFPVHLFDSALPTRPTFAINLGRFAKGREPDGDQRRNVEWAKDNQTGLSPSFVDVPPRGMGALLGFASAAINTSRNWQDSAHLDHPGYRDRIVRILQTSTEGGLNLNMDAATIAELSRRGQVAADVIIDQFTRPHYPPEAPTATGWDNHRWVRYRALLSVLPDWLRSFARGYGKLDIDSTTPPSYPFEDEPRALATQLATELDELAALVAEDGSPTRDGVVPGITREPRPRGILRRIPIT
jgi:hypothetical protein